MTTEERETLIKSVMVGIKRDLLIHQAPASFRNIAERLVIPFPSVRYVLFDAITRLVGTDELECVSMGDDHVYRLTSNKLGKVVLTAFDLELMSQNKDNRRERLKDKRFLELFYTHSELFLDQRKFNEIVHSANEELAQELAENEKDKSDSWFD